MPLQNNYYRGREPWLKRSGDTMPTGATVVLGRDPTAALDSAPKQYVDAAIAAAIAAIPAVPTTFYTMVDVATNVTLRSNAGSFTTGVQFWPQISKTVSGVRFVWRGSVLGSRTVRCRIWRAGASQASVDVVAPASDSVVTATFASPYVVPSGSINSGHWATMWDTTGGNYVFVNNIDVVFPTLPWVATSQVLYRDNAAFVAGDAQPSGSAASERYPVDPIFA